jgi:heme-degrading monooxygenase HmoA
MYARSTIVRGDPHAMDEGIAYVRDSVWPTVQEMEGCIGMSMLADRDIGRCIVTTAWDSERAMRESADRVVETRRAAAEVLRAEKVLVGQWEIALLHRVHPAGAGACVRVIWTENESGRLDDMVDAMRMALLPRMEELPGFCSVSLMLDRDTGRAVAAVTYADREQMDAAREMGTAMREEFADSTGAQITEVAEFDLVIAHLRVPEMA